MSNPSISPAIAEVAERYRRRGYEVITDPPSDTLPKDLAYYHPDLIAILGNERIAVGVKNRRSIEADPDLVRLAEHFRRTPGWRLDIAVLGEAGDQKVPDILSKEELQRRTQAAGFIAQDPEDYAAALLLLWTVVEAILHARLKIIGEDRLLDSGRLAKHAYSLGLIEEQDLAEMEWLVDVRNATAHGRKSPGLTYSDYERARDLAEHLTRPTVQPV